MLPDKNTQKLNLILRQELGSNPYGEGQFRWSWSEECVWPAMKTGRMIGKKIRVPLIGGGEEEAEIPTPEYKAVPQNSNLKDQWVLTRWLSPAMLAGLSTGHFIGNDRTDWSEEMILHRWQTIFPDYEYPARGLHFVTDWANKPHMRPTLVDTKLAIKQLRKQLSGDSAEALTIQMEDQMDAERERKQRITEDMIENEFTAFLNPSPGSRGNFVSFGGADLKEENPTV